MKSYLHNQDIGILFKYKGATQEIQGISFIKGKYSFKGSSIDCSFSYAKIDRQINKNNSYDQKETVKQKTSFQSKSQNTIILSNLTSHLNSLGIPPLKQNKLLSWREDTDEENEEIEQAMKRKNYRRSL